MARWWSVCWSVVRVGSENGRRAAIEEALYVVPGQENAKLHMWAVDGGFRLYITAQHRWKIFQ